MTYSRHLRLAPLGLLLTGCVITPRLRLTELRPERPMFDEASTKAPLAFSLDPRIEDTFVAKSTQGVKDVEVTEFRKTLLTGVRATFPNARVVDSVPAQGLGIALVDVRPSAVKVAAIREGSGVAQYTNYEVKCEINYGATFSRDGAAENVTATVTSRDSASLAAEMGPVCANGLEVMFADLRTRFAKFHGSK